MTWFYIILFSTWCKIRRSDRAVVEAALEHSGAECAIFGIFRKCSNFHRAFTELSGIWGLMISRFFKLRWYFEISNNFEFQLRANPFLQPRFRWRFCSSPICTKVAAFSQHRNGMHGRLWMRLAYFSRNPFQPRTLRGEAVLDYVFSNFGFERILF